MSLRCLTRRVLYAPPMSRMFSSQTARSRRPFLTTRRLLAVSGTTGAGYALFYAGTPSVHAEAASEQSSEDSSSQDTMVELIRQYAVYAMCSSPTLIDWAPSILETLTSIPIIKQVTEAIVSQTFFLQVRSLHTYLTGDITNL